MNDRFKFRIFSKVAKKFIYFDNSELCVDKENMGLLFRTEHLYLGNYEELQQCTGLKDKNGKLIYEGDIVKNHGWWNASGPAGYEKDTCVVEFDKSVCGFTPMCNYDCDCCVYHEAEDLEVIGNIYENEDLLKCENQ